MKKISFLVASSLIGLSLSVQAAPIAIVDGQPIDKSVQDEWIKELVLNGGQDTPEARKQILDNLIASAVVENAAKKTKSFGRSKSENCFGLRQIQDSPRGSYQDR